MSDHAVSDRAERDILGMLLVSPYHLVSLGSLKPEHFRNRSRAEVYRVILETRADGIVLVARELIRRGIPQPDHHGWYSALSSLTDGPPRGFWFVDEDSMPALSQVVQEAAVERARAALSARHQRPSLGAA